METISELLSFLAGGGDVPALVNWPPDAFACAATLLERSGAYVRVVHEWPPPEYARPEQWNDHMRELGRSWRATAGAGQPVAEVLREGWAAVLAFGKKEVASIAEPDAEGTELTHRLLQFLVAADEACAGVGLPGGEPGDKIDAFDEEVTKMLVEQEIAERPATLCRGVPSCKLSVLPKVHTPQNGITIRSLSHHLALCPVTEVHPRWTWVKHRHRERHGLNVLVLPWPLEVKPSHFTPAQPRAGRPRNMPPAYGFFEYNVRGGAYLDFDEVRRLILRASEEVGPVDVVVFPEMALRQEDVSMLSNVIAGISPPPILIGGVAIESADGTRNSSVTLIPLSDGAGAKTRLFPSFQDKHHRWMMDGSQVKQYGLGGILDPAMNWWENSAVPQRSLRFVAVHPWLTLCTLICEDLARPDPIANLVRAVGPNLVIALLMDGPQLARRWPSRYATVLAEDPGSSVLTVSPRGMVRLSRPRGMPASNVVALWKDAQCGDPIEIAMPEGHSAILLSLTRVWREEFSADGRGDGGASAYLTLSGIHPIPG